MCMNHLLLGPFLSIFDSQTFTTSQWTDPDKESEGNGTVSFYTLLELWLRQKTRIKVTNQPDNVLEELLNPIRKWNTERLKPS